MISADGWLDWAERLEPTKQNVNGGVNAVKGVFMHSAEGYASVLLDPRSEYGYNGKLSWHASNLMDGRFVQHYPFTAQCWHATAANNAYVGIENEGYQPREKSLNEAQIKNAVRLIADLSAWKGWRPSRPKSATDTSHTLWEHNEVVRLGGTSTSCPSGRIPWAEILRRLIEQETDMAHLNGDGSQRIVSEGPFIVIYNQNVPVLRVGDDKGQFPGRVSKNFGGNWVYLRALDDTGNWYPNGAEWHATPGD